MTQNADSGIPKGEPMDDDEWVTYTSAFVSPNVDPGGYSESLLLMNDDATVTPLTRCSTCGFLFVDIEKHVRESVTVQGFSLPPNDRPST